MKFEMFIFQCLLFALMLAMCVRMPWKPAYKDRTDIKALYYVLMVIAAGLWLVGMLHNAKNEPWMP